jgi:hypothetical protein
MGEPNEEELSEEELDNRFRDQMGAKIWHHLYHMYDGVDQKWSCKVVEEENTGILTKIKNFFKWKKQ